MARWHPVAIARCSPPAVGHWAVCLLVAAGMAGCGSSSPPPGPYDVVSSYLSQIAEGNYGNACGLLDTGTRAALIKAMGSRTTCARLFVRCLPSQATKISHDQSQLLYANIQAVTHHKDARVTVGGTAVAKAIKRVTLAKEGHTWKLTSYGEALQVCPREHRLHAARRAAVG